MKCIYCNGTGKYKKPNDQEKFDNLVDCEMEKGYFVNLEMAEEKAYKAVGYNGSGKCYLLTAFCASCFSRQRSAGGTFLFCAANLS